MRVSVVGATGMVGEMFLRVMEERKFPVSELYLYATEKSEGVKINFRGEGFPVSALKQENLKPCELALLSAGARTARAWASAFCQQGALVVDNSSAFRSDPGIPLVVPEVNADEIPHHKGIISNPNCSTIGLVAAVYPLHLKFHLKSIIVTSFQSVSGGGGRAIWELKQQMKGELTQPRFLPRKIFDNCIPQIGEFLPDGETVEERKFRDESRKIMRIPELEVCATAVRVPVMVGHSLSVLATFEKPLDANEAIEILSSSPGVKVASKPGDYATAAEVAGSDFIHISRVRMVPGFQQALNFWIVLDNVRKGAATNAVQIAELALLKSHLNPQNQR